MFQSTRPVRGATGVLRRRHQSYSVSIHAPRAGRDHRTEYVQKPCNPCFNPRAPCGARPIVLLPSRKIRLFQSTRPVRGATSRHRLVNSKHLSFNPRAPCGARPAAKRIVAFRLGVSIHAPRAGRDSSIIYQIEISSRGPFSANLIN